MNNVMPPKGTSARRSERSQGHRLLYTPAEERFDRITRLAQHALSVPVTAVMLLNDGRQWFKSASGWDTSELREETALCAWAFEADGPTIIEDMQSDSRTAKHAFVTGDPRLRFYAAYPLLDEGGWPVGGFCVADLKARTLSVVEQQTLLDLAELAQREIRSDGSPPEASLATTLTAVRRESMIDPLTRTWNRRGAYMLLRNACEKADQGGASLAVVTIDIDGFGEINKRFGHQIGDEVLRKFAVRLVNSLRGRDFVFRLFDNRFLLLLADIAEVTAKKVIERVRWTVSGTSVPTRKGNVALAVRTGLIMRAPMDDATIDQLVARAERRMTEETSSLPEPAASTP
jgi:diguanylate cyclase (GGDEF)-like protein